MKKKQTGVILMLAALSLMSIQPVEACTRAVYLGPEQLVITGRTMDWKEDIMSNIYVFPRGIQRVGHNKEKTVNWTSKYGSVIATGYDIGTCDGMNEKAWWLVYFSCPNLFIRFPVISVRQWESVFGRNTCLITLPLYVRPLMN